jgi:hypothetical protein
MFTKNAKNFKYLGCEISYENEVNKKISTKEKW